MFTDIICGECDDKDPTKKEDPARNGYYEFQWNRWPTRPTKNPNGTTGWATLLYTTSTNPTYNRLDLDYRFHVCVNDPCNCRWDKSKYGDIPEPTHVRIVPKRPPTTVAEPPSSAVASSDHAPSSALACADSSGSAVASSETVAEEVVVADSSSPAGAISETVPDVSAGPETAPEEATPEEEVMTEVHIVPKGTPLSAMAPLGQRRPSVAAMSLALWMQLRVQPTTSQLLRLETE